MLKKIISLVIVLIFGFESTGFAQVAGQLDISSQVSAGLSNIIQDKFRPIHLRYLSFNPTENNFKLLLDKGSLKNPDQQLIDETTKELLKYFLIGVTLPNDSFWVNLRPDATNEVMDESLAKTDVGKILIEADLQLKRDTAKYTSPQTPEGKEYWNKLYQKAEELYGNQQITIPTLNRPWIVPDEIIVRENQGSAYIYKATMKVMLEDDYLKGSQTYNFTDDKAKALNEYSSQLLKETIIPKITKEINSAKRYASLRQVYYSLILAQWFKSKYKDSHSRVSGNPDSVNSKINSKDLTGLTSKESWSRDTYYQAYQKSFKDGEYNIKEPKFTANGQVIRSYVSGGIVFTNELPRLIEAGLIHSNLGYDPGYFKACFKTEASITKTGDLKVSKSDFAVEQVVLQKEVVTVDIKDKAFARIVEKLNETDGVIKLNSVQMNILAKKMFLPMVSDAEKQFALKIFYRLTYKQRIELEKAFNELSHKETRRAALKLKTKVEDVTDLQANIFVKKLNVISAMSEATLKSKLDKYYSRIGVKMEQYANIKELSIDLLYRYVKSLSSKKVESLEVQSKKNSNFLSRVAVFITALFVATLASKAMVDMQKKDFSSNHDQALNEFFGDQFDLGFVAAADMVMQHAWEYSGPNWASSAMTITEQDVSADKYLDVLVNANMDGKIKIQLLDPTIVDGSAQGVSSVIDVHKGQQTVRIDLAEYKKIGVDLKHTSRIAMHYGKETWGTTLNSQDGFYASMVGYEFIAVEEKKEISLFDSIGKFFADLFSFKVSMFAASADMTINPSNVYSGPGWASSAMDFELSDVSSKDYLDVLINANTDGKIKIQMLDPDIKDGDGFFGLANTVFSVQKGEQVVRVDLHQFSEVDLTKVRRIVVHSGEKAWGEKLNNPGFVAQFKGYEFVSAPKVVAKEVSFFDSIGKFFADLFSFKLFAVSADMTMQSAQKFTGNNWESLAISPMEKDVSAAKYMDIAVEVANDGKVYVQLLDKNTNDGANFGVIGPFAVKKGEQKIRVDLSSYKYLGVDLTNVRKIVVHSGQEAWGAKINNQNLWAEFKGYEFTSVEEAQQEESIFDTIGKFFANIFGFKLFAVTADKVTMTAQVFSGPNWASAVMPVPNMDVSGDKYLNVEVEAATDGQVSIQLLDKNIADGSNRGVLGPYKVHAGVQTIQISTQDYAAMGVDLKTVREIVVHYGKETWGRQINEAGFSMKFKGYEFSVSNNANVPTAIPTTVVTSIPTSAVVRKETVATEKITTAVSWMQSTKSPVTGLSKSFKPTASDLSGITNSHEKRVLRDGVVTYDGALETMLDSLAGDGKIAEKFISIYTNDNLVGYRTIYGGYAGNKDQPFIYDPSNPNLVGLHDGYPFKILDASGMYSDAEGVTWSQWQPISGEAAWIGMSAMQLHYQKYGNQNSNTVELKLAEKLARVAMILQSDNGGIRMAPIGTWSAHETGNDPYTFKWLYNEISTENCISWYANFKMLYEITGKAEYKNSMNKLEGYFKSAYDSKNEIMAQGMHYSSSEQKWVANSIFATDCQTWFVTFLGVQKVDAMFGDGAAYKMWENSKSQAGVYDQKGNFLGFDFTNYKVLGRNAVVSVEWTEGGIMGAKDMIEAYKQTHPDWSANLQKDVTSAQQYVDTLKTSDGAYFYSSERADTGHGWTAAGKIGSGASTVWVILEREFNFNPSILGGGKNAKVLPVSGMAQQPVGPKASATQASASGAAAILAPIVVAGGIVAAKKVKNSKEDDGGKNGAKSGMGGSAEAHRDVSNHVGGIDFRALPIITQQAVYILAIGDGGTAAMMPLISKLETIDLDQKIAELQKMVDADIVPSAGRIKEYVQAACLRESKEHLDKLLACMVSMMKIEEQKCCGTNRVVKDMMLVLESGISNKDLKRIVKGS